MRSSIYRPIKTLKDVETILRSMDQLLQRKAQRNIAVPRENDGEEGDIVTFYDTRFSDPRRVYTKVANSWQRIPFVPNTLSLAGYDNTERTTTSTTSVDLSTVAVDIRFNIPFIVMANVRKTTGAANTASFGLKLNSTQVISNTAVLGSVNEAVSGMLRLHVGPRVTNYLRAIEGRVLAGNAEATNMYANADMPTVNITQVIITAQVGDAAITAGCDEVKVYTLPVI